MGELRAATAGFTQEQKAAFANTVAGTEAQKGLLAVLNASQSDYDKLSDAINHADGAAKICQRPCLTTCRAPYPARQCR